MVKVPVGNLRHCEMAVGKGDSGCEPPDIENVPDNDYEESAVKLKFCVCARAHMRDREGGRERERD